MFWLGWLAIDCYVAIQAKLGSNGNRLSFINAQSISIIFFGELNVVVCD